MKEYLVADLFCGAGGSSTGAMLAIKEIGGKMVLVCVNHWQVAIETHKKNHPTAQHYVEDVTAADPYKIVPGGYLDLLMASPECRFYSRARGGKPVYDQGRMNPWAVHRWLTALDVQGVLIENVSEFVNWGPLLPDGRPDPKGKGLFFQAWFKTFTELGYRAEWRNLNAADYGDATTRVRFFLIARKDDKPIRWPEATHFPFSEDMLGTKKTWKTAREIIDWNNIGRSLLDDPKYQRRPLAVNTRRRIAHGLEKFGGPLAPLYIQLLGMEESQEQINGDSQPFVMGKQGHPAYRSVDEPIMTLTTEARPVLIQPVAEPFVLGQQSGSKPRSTDNPIPTISGAGAIALVEPVVLGQHSGVVRGVDEPIPTCATHGGISVTTPLMVKYFGTGICHPVDEPLSTVTTKDRVGLVNPVITPFMVQWDQTGGNGKYTRSVDQPVPTIVTKQNTGLVESMAVGLVEPILEHIESGDVDPRRLILIDNEPYLLDIRFRMLHNDELARAMGFMDEDIEYKFTGTVADVTKQIGNAVAVNTARALVKVILEDFNYAYHN